jgi:hypothetical protein
MITLNISEDHPDVVKAAEASGLHGEALLEKALKRGLKALSQPKRDKRKGYRAGDTLPTGEVVEFVEDGVPYVMREEFKAKLLAAAAEPIDRKNLMTFAELRTRLGLPQEAA